MSKNPFEVRLDVLKMAQEMVNVELGIKQEKYSNMIEAARINNVGNMESVVLNGCPTMYDTIEVIKKAEELYAFITSNSTTVKK